MKQLKNGGPKEDRTPDLFIAKVTAVLDINDLATNSVAENSPKHRSKCTKTAQRRHMHFPAMHHHFVGKSSLARLIFRKGNNYKQRSLS